MNKNIEPTIFVFDQIKEATNRIISYLKMITEFNKQINVDQRSAYLKDKKEQFITDVIFIKQNSAIIEHKLGLSYIEYITHSLKELTQTLYDQLNVFDLCVEQQNPELYFELDNNSSLIQIAKYNNENLKYHAFKEIESAIYSHN